MQRTASSNGWLVQVLALFAAAFAVCTAELIVAGVLPALAADLEVDVATAGLLITGYALGVAVFGPVLALATGRVPRRRLLLVVLGVFVVGNVLCAVATDYWGLLAARLVVAASHGLMFGISMVIATRVAPEGRKTSAVSLVVAGVTLASVLGLPLGSAIGNAFGWRMTLWIIAGLGAAAALLVALMIPETRQPPPAPGDLRRELQASVRPAVLISYTIIALYMVAIFSLFSYIVPLLSEVSGIPVAQVPWVLFAMGGVGVVGNLAGGRLGDWNASATMIGILVGTMVLFLLLSQVVADAWLAVPLLVGSWMIGFGFPAPVQGRILREIADAPNFGATLISTAFNIGIAGGAALGAAAIAAGLGYANLPLLTVLFIALALAATLGLVAYDRRRFPALA